MVLRTRREELGWRLEDVGEWLRIRPKLLAALEDDDLTRLPGVAYAIGFLRTYARAMDLDAEALVERFRRDTRGAVTRKPELVFPTPEADHGLPVGVLVGAGLVVVVASYIGWYRFTAHDTPAQRQVPAVSELMSGAATPATTSPQVASVMPGRAPAGGAQSVVSTAPLPAAPQTHTQLVTPTAPVPGSGATSASIKGEVTAAPSVDTQPPSEPAASTPDGGSTTATDSAVPTPSNAGPPATGLPPAVPEGAVVVRTLSAVWTQIKDRDGHVLLSRVMQPGESWQGDPAAAPFRMSFGNAGGVVLTTAGATSAPLGKAGEVRRNVDVTADAIRAGTFGSGVALPVLPNPQPLSPVHAASGSAVPETVHTPSGTADNDGISGTHPTVVQRSAVHVVPHSAPHDESADDLNARQLQRQMLDQSSQPH